MPRKTSWKDEVPLHLRTALSLPQLSGQLGFDDDYMTAKDRTVWNDEDQTDGVATLPGGIKVPVFRDVNGYAVVYRRMVEQAQDEARAARLQRWNGTQAVEP